MRLWFRRWRDWPVAAKGLLILSLPLLLLLGSLISGYELGKQVAKAEAEALRTLQVQSDIQALHKLIAEAAVGVRGYLLTGRDDFLTPYWAARDEIINTVDKLDARVHDVVQRERLAQLRPLVDEKLASLDQLRISGRLLTPEALHAHLIESKQVLDRVREQLYAMQAREAELVEERTLAANAALRRNLSMSVATAAIGLLVAAFVVVLFITGIVQRVRAIAANAERLVQGQALAPLPIATDELGQVTERLHRASAMMARRAAEAQSANRAKTEFLSRISHELRTPLNAILGFAQLLEADALAGHPSRYVQQILRAGRHLLGLINELLDISRIEAGQINLAPVPTALRPLLTEALDVSEGLARRHCVRLEAPECDPTIGVLADRQRLMQVLLNLISNAVKYNHANGWVRVRVGQPDARVRIDIQDSGVGIDASRQDRLFQPFERLGAEANAVEGSGLGLAIAKRLIEAMDGIIEVRSAHGEGSTFTLSLPAAQAALPPVLEGITTYSTPIAAEAPSPIRTVLSIEDNASNRALIEALVLKRPSWRLISASSGAEGLRLATEHNPSLILLDLNLPDSPGERVLRGLREIHRLASAAVVVLTADVLPETRERLLRAGATDYLTKPLDVRRFLSLLDKLQT